MAGRARTEAGSSGPQPPPTLRALVVEDHPFHQNLNRSLLEAIGCEVVVVGNGFEAIEAANDQPFDLILMDRRLPGCDGDIATELIRATAAASGKAWIVCCSTDRPTGAIAELYDHIVAKPLTPSAVAGAIHGADVAPRHLAS